jgi:hypothetical protein
MPFGISWAKLAIIAALAFIVGLGVYAVRHTISRLETQAGQIATLERDLKAEQLARKRDVDGLTTLAQGVIAASNARAIDQESLRETIDTKNPQPVSAQLGSFLNCLRQGDRSGAKCSAASGPGGARPAASGSPATYPG